MGVIKVQYLKTKHYKGKDYYYWTPNSEYIVAGEKVKCPMKSECLGTDKVKALARAEALNESLNSWRAGLIIERTNKDGSFCWLIGEYKGSKWFKELGERTQREYGYILETIRETLREKGIADEMAADFTRQHARLLHNLFSGTPRKAQLVVAISRIVFNYGIETGHIKEGGNPFQNMRIKRNRARNQIWLDVDSPDNMLHKVITLKEAAIARGVPSMAFAVDLALFSMQRQGDLLRLPWNKYDGREIRLKQGKTQKWVYIPVTRMPVFKEILDKRMTAKTSPLMLISERTGNPYDKDHCGDVFREVRAHAGLPDDLQFRDLRRTGMVLWAMAGAEPQEIAAISGHTIEETTNILEIYLPRNMRMAEHGADKLQAKYGDQLRALLPIVGKGA